MQYRIVSNQFLFTVNVSKLFTRVSGKQLLSMRDVKD
jgi:hypothetical protein